MGQPCAYVRETIKSFHSSEDEKQTGGSRQARSILEASVPPVWLSGMPEVLFLEHLNCYIWFAEWAMGKQQNKKRSMQLTALKTLDLGVIMRLK